jgi:glycosyltransferase involved in cell wall biosynthesis
MSRPFKALFITIVPSPYQRDLFKALAARDDVELSIHYMEAASPDSPWPEVPLESYERIMPGFWMPLAGARAHVNWRLPEFSETDVVVLSSFTSLTGQWLMRRGLRGRRWLFWGERLRGQTGWKQMVQHKLIAPLARASGIVGIGQEAARDYQHRFPAQRHFCIPYYCDLSQFTAAPRRAKAHGPLRFLFCGQMIRRKGVDLLLAAFDGLVAKGIEARLLLVGREADLQELLGTVSNAARSRICYKGFQSPNQLPKYFSQSDVFVLPSRHDGWGVVINQALGAGLPIISSDAVGAALDLVEQGVNGLRFSSGDVKDLQSAMERFAVCPDLVSEWGEASRQKSFAMTPEEGARKWVQVFASLREQNVVVA